MKHGQSADAHNAPLRSTSRTPHAPFSFGLLGKFLSLPLSLLLCLRRFALQPDKEFDQKPMCRTQHARRIIFCFRALMMFRTLDSHNSKVVRRSVRSLRPGSCHKDYRAPGPPLMSICPTHVCQLVHRHPLLSSGLIFPFVKTSRTPPDMLYLEPKIKIIV